MRNYQHKDPKVTQQHIDNIKEAMEYFDEVVLCVPPGKGTGLFKFYGLSAARADDRLYIHGVEELQEKE